MTASLIPLCVADDTTFWPWRTWADFARLPLADRAAMAVVVPIVGLAGWGLGHALDAEELVLTHLLRAALPLAQSHSRHLMIPPLRFVLGPAEGCAFAVDSPVAHAFIREIATSIAAAGFRRLILVNSSPWNEELCAAASRDLRIELGLQISRVNLSMIDLDFHPVRSKSRRDVQTLITSLVGAAPEVVASPGLPDADPGGTWGDEAVRALAGPALTLEAASTEGPVLLADRAARLAALLDEIAAQPPLPRQGALVTMSAP